jgi:hypothetical protein
MALRIDPKTEQYEPQNLQVLLNQSWDAFCVGQGHPGNWLEETVRGNEDKVAKVPASDMAQ